MRRVCEAGTGLMMRGARRRRKRLALTLAVCAAILLCCARADAAQTRRPSARPPAPKSARHAPFKAVFEPVSYPYDVEISDIYFVDAETGWACGHHFSDAGEGGFIIGTRDGGRTWTLQFGNRDSSTRAFSRVYFLDATHGWATQIDGTLVRTTDGVRWAPSGKVSPTSPIVFVSPERGFSLEHGRGIHTTVDGGRTWRLGSLCEPVAIGFGPDRASSVVATRAPDGTSAVILTTGDGGERWTQTSIVHNVDVNDISVALSDSSTGYLRAGAAVKMTLDGGRTWHPVPATVPYDSSKILVAGAVAWMVGSHDFSYTLDRGKRWMRRQIEFPARVLTAALPDPGTGYVAGSHGMIYRYRVVPFDYTAPGMLVVPGLTTFAPMEGAR